MFWSKSKRNPLSLCLFFVYLKKVFFFSFLSRDRYSSHIHIQGNAWQKKICNYTGKCNVQDKRLSVFVEAILVTHNVWDDDDVSGKFMRCFVLPCLFIIKKVYSAQNFYSFLVCFFLDFCCSQYKERFDNVHIKSTQNIYIHGADLYMDTYQAVSYLKKVDNLISLWLVIIYETISFSSFLFMYEFCGIIV